MRRLAILCALAIMGLHARGQAQDHPGAAWCSEEPCPRPEYDATRVEQPRVRAVPGVAVPFRGHARQRSNGHGGREQSIPVANVGVVTTNDAKLVSFTQSFLADIRLVKWLGLSMGFAVGNAVGINDSGAFNLGINYAFGGTLRLSFRLAQEEVVPESMRGDGVVQRAEAVLPAALAQSAQDQNGNITYSISSLAGRQHRNRREI